jgi:hypothetical protein
LPEKGGAQPLPSSLVTAAVGLGKSATATARTDSVRAWTEAEEEKEAEDKEEDEDAMMGEEDRGEAKAGCGGGGDDDEENLRQRLQTLLRRARTASSPRQARDAQPTEGPGSSEEKTDPIALAAPATSNSTEAEEEEEEVQTDEMAASPLGAAAGLLRLLANFTRQARTAHSEAASASRKKTRLDPPPAHEPFVVDVCARTFELHAIRR